jgi:hypothetical protein
MTSSRTECERRSVIGMKGCWVSLEEAKEYAEAGEWWTATLGRKSVPIPPNNDKPIWKYQSGQMYLGSWIDTATFPVEHGFGISYYRQPEKIKGLVYIGGRKDGTYHGKGRTLWLPSSKTWRTNSFYGSPIRQRIYKFNTINRRTVGLPFEYLGRYLNGHHHDENAIVTLKDGTTRRGPWKDGKPVGDWWKDHEIIPRPLHKPLARNINQHDPQQAAHQRLISPALVSQSSEELDSALDDLPSANTSRPGGVARLVTGQCSTAETTRPPSRRLRQPNERRPPGRLRQSSNEDTSIPTGAVAHVATGQGSAVETRRPQKKRRQSDEDSSSSSGAAHIAAAADQISDEILTAQVEAGLEKWRTGKLFITIGVKKTDSILEPGASVPDKSEKEHPFNKFLDAVATEIAQEFVLDRSEKKSILRKLQSKADRWKELLARVTTGQGAAAETRRPPSRRRQSDKDTSSSSGEARVATRQDSTATRSLIDVARAALARHTTGQGLTVETRRPPSRRRQSDEDTTSSLIDVARAATGQGSTAAETSRPKKKQRQSSEDTANAAVGGGEESVAAPDPIPDSPPLSSGPQQEGERDRKTLELTDWLAADVIARSPIMEEMRVYAQELIKEGFHSSEVVTEFCTVDDISSWTWMLPIHKRIFRAWVRHHGNHST